MAANLVRAFNFSQGDTAALLGPNRSRIMGVLVNAAAACTFQLRNGTAAGDILLDLTLPTGWNDVYIPVDGILASDGCFVATLTGTSNKITLLLEQVMRFYYKSGGSVKKSAAWTRKEDESGITKKLEIK